MPPIDLPPELRAKVLPDVLTVEDLAEHLRLSTSAVRAALRRGEIPGRRLGRRWYCDRLELLAALRPRRDLRVVGSNL
jgi:excisionase family DNA binding protein